MHFVEHSGETFLLRGVLVIIEIQLSVFRNGCYGNAFSVFYVFFSCRVRSAHCYTFEFTVDGGISADQQLQLGNPISDAIQDCRNSDDNWEFQDLLEFRGLRGRSRFFGFPRVAKVPGTFTTVASLRTSKDFKVPETFTVTFVSCS